jgi:hypothetical protein
MDFGIMEKTTIELTKVTAAEGMWLANGETYSKEIYLGCNDSIDNWHEITDAEYEEIVKAEEDKISQETRE